MNRAERRRADRKMEENFYKLKLSQDFSSIDPQHKEVIENVINPSPADQALAADHVQKPCYYCGDTQSPAAVIKERNMQVICLHCINKGVGRYDTSWQKK